MGYAFTYPVIRHLTAGIRPKRVPIIAYIHYPTISSSMLHRVSSRKSNYANSGQIASSSVLSTGKLWWLLVPLLSPRTYSTLSYYRMFASMYIYCLRTSHTTLSVNSSWTGGHIDSLLSTPVHQFPAPISFLLSAFTLSIPADNKHLTSTKIIYPPCDTQQLTQLPLERRQHIILSIAQFRFAPSFKS
jgi:alpha-1,2-mannosyltransferase